MASGIALIVCLIGVYLSITNWDAATVMSEQEDISTYLIVLYGEIIIGGIGAFVLIKFKRRQYVASFIAFIVGSHFFFLVDVFSDPSLNVLAILLIIVAILSPWLANKLETAISAITGIGSGSLLFCFALLGLIRYLGA